MNLPSLARIYLSLVVLAAVGFMAYWFEAWRGPVPEDLALMAVLTILAIAAMHFPLTITPRCKVEVSMAAYFASLLVFGIPAAMAIVGVSQLVGGLTLNFRQHPVPGRYMRSLRSVLFNTSQLMLAVGMGGAVYYSLLPRVAPAPLTRMENLWAIPAAAAMIYLVNSAAVAIMAGLQLGQSAVDIFRSSWRINALQFAGLFLIGLVTALTSSQNVWVPLVMALPTGLVYLSLKRTVELMEQTISAVEAMADVVDMRDHYTYEHSKRVAEYAFHIARRMGLPSDEVKTIALSARVHDLGKMGVPDRILLKPDKLTPEEWDIMKRHPQIGHEILSRFPQYRRGKDLVLFHHERYDGRGYPNGTAGDKVVIGAQIIAVADALEAMTSDRPYRQAMSLNQAMSEFRRYKGVQWHPEVVDALETLVDQQGSSVLSRTGIPVGA